MYDQSGGAIAAGTVRFQVTFHVDEDLFRFYWRVSIPYSSNTWGGFRQDLPPGGVSLGFDRPYVLYEDQYYDTHIVRWYRWDDVRAGSDFRVWYEASYTSTMSFSGRADWDNDEEEHEGTYWVGDENSNTASYAADRSRLRADAAHSEHLCGTWPLVDLATAFTSAMTGYCSEKTFTWCSLTRGWVIPTGQVSGIMLPGTMQFGGVSGRVDGTATHSCTMHWCDCTQEWMLVEPSICSMGQSPQMFIFGAEADEHWVNWAFSRVGGTHNPDYTVTFPVGECETDWSSVELVGGRSRIAPTPSSGLDEGIASQRYSFLGERAAMRSADAPGCESLTMVGARLASDDGEQVAVVPNPVVALAQFVTGNEDGVVRVYDVRGRWIGEGRGAVVTWSTRLTPGVYFARFPDVRGETVRKFIVIR